MLVSEAWERYKSDKRIEGYSSLTLKMYGFQCNLLRRHFGDIEMGGFTTENLKQYLGEAGGHLSRLAWAIVYGSLSHYLNGLMRKVSS